MKKILALILTLMMIVTGVAIAETEECYIGISLDTVSEAFWQAAYEACIDEAAKYDFVKTEILIAEGDAQKQNEQIESLIAMGVDYIVCGLVDSTAIITAIEKCNEAGIPFISINRSSNGGDVALTIKADNYALTYNATKQLAEYGKANGLTFTVIELMGDIVDTNAMARSEGYHDAMAEYPDMFKVVSTVYTEWDADKALEGTIAALQANPDVNCILAGADGLVIGAISGLKTFNRYLPREDANHVWLVGVDGDSRAIELIHEGYYDISCVQDIETEARMAVQAAVSLYNGETLAENVVTEEGFSVNFENYKEIEFMGF